MPLTPSHGRSSVIKQDHKFCHLLEVLQNSFSVMICWTLADQRSLEKGMSENIICPFNCVFRLKVRHFRRRSCRIGTASPVNRKIFLLRVPSLYRSSFSTQYCKPPFIRLCTEFCLFL